MTKADSFTKCLLVVLPAVTKDYLLKNDVSVGLPTVMRFCPTTSAHKNRFIRVTVCKCSRVALIIGFIAFYKQ